MAEDLSHGVSRQPDIVRELTTRLLAVVLCITSPKRLVFLMKFPIGNLAAARDQLTNAARRCPVGARSEALPR